ncbi:MAG: inorganic phosphate transporter [Elusimicrobiota bacterium]
MILNFLNQIKFLGGVYLGWGVGANDTANIFGPAVATDAIKYKTAIIIAAIFILLGAVTEGPGLMKKIGDLAGDKFTITNAYASSDLALVSSLAAGLTIMLLTYFSIPASTSQASIGSIMGIGIFLSGLGGAQWSEFLKILFVWVVNPVGTAIVSFLLFKILAVPVNNFIKSNLLYNRIFSILLLLSGAYGAYALGASHAAVTTAPFYRSGVFGSPQSRNAAFLAALAGGIGMSTGVLTYSKKVMDTVGKKIAVLDPFSSFICLTGAAATVHICKQIGVPVSTSQAIVGSVTGVGMVKGVRTINFSSLIYIFLGWIMTPIAGAIFCILMIKIFL